MDNLNYIDNYLTNSINTKQKLMDSESLKKDISAIANLIIKTYSNGNKVILAGNGGSAADAQHIAAEFVSRFFFDRPGLPALSLTTDTSMLTAIGNDYGYENLFSRQLQAQSKPGDVFIGISTSGNSKNVLKAVESAKGLGVITVALCGEVGRLKEVSDYALAVPSRSTPYIQECHICIGHMICAIVEESIFSKEKDV